MVAELKTLEGAPELLLVHVEVQVSTIATQTNAVAPVFGRG